jgi:Zn-dependent peptidase ImmA (M78 family)
VNVKEIENRAYELLTKFDVASYPIPIEDLARSLGIRVHYEPFDGDLSGILLRDEDRTIIGINSRHASVRQRFTVAHELGHFLLHAGNKVHVDREFRVNFRDVTHTTGSAGEEMEANRFAAAILMPESLMREAFRRKTSNGFDPLGDDDEAVEFIQKLAREFKVSYQALLIRLGELGLQ